MKRTKEQRLAVAAVRILDEAGPDFNMSTYVETWNCGTSCCLSGHAVLPMGKRQPPQEFTESQADRYETKAMDFCGEFPDNMSRFLFSGSWPNDRKQCGARVLHFLKGEKIPEWFPLSDRGGEKYEKKLPVPRNLREQLMAFVPEDLRTVLNQ
jgi:hypothetical protein